VGGPEPQLLVVAGDSVRRPWPIAPRSGAIRPCSAADMVTGTSVLDDGGNWQAEEEIKESRGSKLVLLPPSRILNATSRLRDFPARERLDSQL
jgi:hypothetical protein